jgi:plastocyanin
MSRSLFDTWVDRGLIDTRVDRVLGASTRWIRRKGRRPKAGFPLWGEALEDRTLLATATVHLINFAFSPSAVTINVGDTVHWVWDTDHHSTTSVTGSAEQWDSGVHNSGYTFDHTFTKVGTFAYYCTMHGSDNGNGTAGGMSGTVTVNSTPTLDSIGVTPANPSVPKGLTEQFDATGTYSDGTTKDLTTQVTWGSAAITSATISNASGSKGLATAVAPGTSTITAMLNGVGGLTVLTVTAAALQSIAIAPGNPSIPAGEVQPYAATGTYSDGTTLDITTQVTWTSADATVATISNDSNTPGVATGVAPGASTISATLSGVTGSTGLTVTPAILVMIMVTPDKSSVPKGQTEPFMAMGMYSDNSMQDLTTQVTWASTDTAVATISNTAGSAGMATAVATGQSTISATMDGMMGSTVMTVTLLPALSPVAVNDNGQGGYYQYGPWLPLPGGYNGTYAVASPTSSPSASSRWLMTLPAGTYDLYATWVNAADNATNTAYAIYDGFNQLGTVQANQQLAPADGQYGGVDWAKLGTFTVADGRITILLSASGANGNVVADGILVVSSTSPPTIPVPPSSGTGGTQPANPGPISPASPSGPGQGATTTVPVNSTGDSSTGQAVGSSHHHRKARKRTHPAHHQVKAKHHRKIHESLIDRIARELLSPR